LTKQDENTISCEKLVIRGSDIVRLGDEVDIFDAENYMEIKLQENVELTLKESPFVSMVYNKQKGN
jgi:hypothetical protein